MNAGRPYVVALISALALYVIITAYNISMLEYRLGKIEHILCHVGVYKLPCR